MWKSTLSSTSYTDYCNIWESTQKKYGWKCNYFCVFQPFVKYSVRRDFILRLQKALALIRKKVSNSYTNHAKKWRFMFYKCLGCENTNTFGLELYLQHNFKFHLKPCKYPVLIKIACISNNTFYTIVEKIRVCLNSKQLWYIHVYPA